MRATPYITIYTGDDDRFFLKGVLQKARLIFSKYLPYNRKLSRTRINIHLNADGGVHSLGSIHSISYKCPPNSFQELSEKEQLMLILKIIYDALKEIGNARNWEIKVFEEAYQSAITGDQHLLWYTKFQWNETRQLKARIRIVVEEDERVSIIAEFFDKKELRYEMHVMDTFIVHADWFNTFSKPLWFDNDTYGFRLQSGQVLIEVDTRTKTVTTSITEKYLSLADLNNYLKMLQYRKFASKEEMVKWINT